jgi:hypothetical protein
MANNDRYIDNMDIDGPMPTGVKEIFEALRYEVAWLHAKWSIYSQLFCQGDERLEFLDSMAPGFFVVVRDSLQNDLIVGLCRLTDPSTIGKKENLTLSRLAESLGADNNSLPLIQQFGFQLDYLNQTCSPLREWRNRRLGHSDLPTALGSGPSPLPEVTWSAIDEALEEVRALMNLLEKHYLSSEFFYESFTDLGEGEDLVFYLKEAQRCEEEERRRVLGTS